MPATALSVATAVSKWAKCGHHNINVEGLLSAAVSKKVKDEAVEIMHI